MRADLWTYLSENCLVKTDRASMAYGLEVRVPMLGNEVLDAVLELPAEAHFDADGKALLRAIARRVLPESVWGRPKHGFSVPLGANLAGPWRAQCEAWLAEARIRAPYLDAAAVNGLWRGALAGRGSVRLAYTFAVLLGWLAHHPLAP
jgi:asparagine synthase (glutamine-hydrolysing)